MEQALDRDPRAATTDRQLLFDIGNHDERSFDILYHRYARPVAWTARSLLGTNGQEEEAVQATFLALWRKASTIDLVGDSALIWLLGACRLECRNIRSREFKRRTRALGEEEANLEAAAPRLEDEVITRQLIEQVNTFVAELSDVDQAIYELCMLNDFTYEAAARKLGISHGAVRNRLSRLKKTLQKRLGPQYKGDQA